MGGENLAKLLVSVRGPKEAVEAAAGGAHILDVEFPESALGTPYPLNILSVRERLNKNDFKGLPISTNIGEKQPSFRTACQSALGVAIAGADYIKCGFAGLDLKTAQYLGDIIVRTIKNWYPEKKVYPAVFPEEEFSIPFEPLLDGPKLVKKIGCDGLLIDTFNKEIGKGLVDYYTNDQIKKIVEEMHSIGKEAWIAGSISEDQLPDLVSMGVDVICVRRAACIPLKGRVRFGEISKTIVSSLIKTMSLN